MEFLFSIVPVSRPLSGPRRVPRLSAVVVVPTNGPYKVKIETWVEIFTSASAWTPHRNVEWRHHVGVIILPIGILLAMFVSSANDKIDSLTIRSPIWLKKSKIYPYLSHKNCKKKRITKGSLERSFFLQLLWIYIEFLINDFRGEHNSIPKGVLFPES